MTNDLLGIPLQEFYKLNNLIDASAEQKVAGFNQSGLIVADDGNYKVNSSEQLLQLYELAYQTARTPNATLNDLFPYPN